MKPAQSIIGSHQPMLDSAKGFGSRQAGSVCWEGVETMNARTTSLLTVLALALAACVAPMPAPPIKAPQPKTEQVLIPQIESAKNKLPVTQPSMNAFDLFEQSQQQKKANPITGYPDILKGVLEGSMTTTPYMLPEQMATNPKQPAVQELDNMLKPETLPASTMPVRDQWYLEEMGYVQTMPPYIIAEQKATNPKQPDVQAMDDLLKPETLPASTMPVRDQWYLDEQTTTAIMEPWYYFDNTGTTP
jgi:hypothetical protein